MLKSLYEILNKTFYSIKYIRLADIFTKNEKKTTNSSFRYAASQIATKNRFITSLFEISLAVSKRLDTGWLINLPKTSKSMYFESTILFLVHIIVQLILALS